MREDIYLNVCFREKKEENVESVPENNKTREMVETDEVSNKVLSDLEKKKLKRSLYGKKYYERTERESFCIRRPIDKIWPLRRE
jgi:hypothetical protein